MHDATSSAQNAALRHLPIVTHNLGESLQGADVSSQANVNLLQT
jgi:hypothetical protein